jgi:hypothetical protein
MEPNFWALAGPTAFIEQIARAAQDGRNALVRLPVFLPEGLAPALRAQLRLDEVPHITLNAQPGAPIAQVARALAGGERDLIPTVIEMLEDPTLGYQTVVVCNLDPADWPAWCVLLAEWQVALPRVAPRVRPRWVVLLDGPGFTPELPPAVTTDCLSFGPLWETDIAAWADALLRAQDLALGRLARRIVRGTLVEVARWDVAMVAELAQETPETILSPGGWLLQLAAKRHWTKTTPESVAAGTAGHWDGDGKYGVHLGLDLLRNPEEAGRLLEHRLWQAQAAVLLPWVEERRIEAVERHRAALTAVKPYANLDELDVGELWYAAEYAHLPDREKKRIRFLRQVRNEIAHHRRLPPEKILNDDLWR